jgi:hypothetical protein
LTPSRCLVLLVAALAVVPAGCGGDEEADARGELLGRGTVRVVPWATAGPPVACEDRVRAERRAGRVAVRALTASAPSGCVSAIDLSTSLAGRADLVQASLDGCAAEVRFDADASKRMSQLGAAAHVGLVVGDRLLAVVHPEAGRLLFPAPRNAECQGA